MPSWRAALALELDELTGVAADDGEFSARIVGAGADGRSFDAAFDDVTARNERTNWQRACNSVTGLQDIDSKRFGRSGNIALWRSG